MRLATFNRKHELYDSHLSPDFVNTRGISQKINIFMFVISMRGIARSEQGIQQ